MRTRTLVVIIFFSFSLWGCATGNVQSAHISADQPLEPGHGVVALQVVNNGPRLGEHNRHWTSVTLVRTDNVEALKADAEARGARTREGEVDWSPDYYSLPTYNSGFLENRLFVGSVPEGTYRVVRLFSFFSDGDVTSRMSMPVRSMGGTFTVEGGRYTDLGTLVFQPLGNMTRTSFWTTHQQGDAFVARADVGLGHGDFLAKAYPHLADSIDFSQPLTWKSDALDDFRQQLAGVVEENTYGERFISLDDKGGVAFPVRLGRVNVFSADGEFYTEKLPTQSQIFAAMALDRKTVYAGEKGTVYVREHDDADWRTYQPVGQDQVIVWMGKLKDGYAAKVRDGEARNIYRFTDFSEGWELIDSSEASVNILSRATHGTFNPLATADGRLRIIGEGEVRDYDPATRQWSIVNGPRLKDVEISPNGVAVGINDSFLHSTNRMISRDYGLTWQSLGQQRRVAQGLYQYAGLPKLLDDGSVIALTRQYVGPEHVARLQPTRIPPGALRDQQAWEFSGRLPEDCEELVVQLTNAEDLYLRCDHGDLVRSRDKGQTWETVININMQAMRERFEALIDDLSEEAEDDSADVQAQTSIE